jgi:hypothetical protein
MSATSTTTNKNKDRNSNMRSTTNKQPLFEQFNAIVENGKKKHTQSSKKQSKKTRGGESVEQCDNESSQMNNMKRQKITQPTKNISGKPNYHSGSSDEDDDEGYDDIQKKSHNLLENKSDMGNVFNESSDSEDDSENEGSVSREIKDAVDNSSVDTNTDVKNNDTNKKIYENQSAFLSPPLISSLQWYVRNTLFQKVKIIDETHLEPSGEIIQEALEKIKIDKSSNHIHAYITECRRIIKRAMCSRRGYVKHRIGVKLKSKYGAINLYFM